MSRITKHKKRGASPGESPTSPVRTGWSLRSRLLLQGTLVTGLAVFTTVGLVAVFVFHQSRDHLLDEMIVRSKSLAANLEAAVDFEDHVAVQEMLGFVESDPRIERIEVVTLEGETLGSYIRPGKVLQVPDPWPQATFAGDVLHVSRVIESAGQVSGRLLITCSTRLLWKRFLQTLAAALTIAGAATLLGLLLSLRLQRQITGPMRDLVDIATRVIRERDYAARATVRTGDEVGSLTHTFNMMLDKIQRRDRELLEHRDQLECRVAERTRDLEAARLAAEAASQAKSEFLANMSHEIRTPMTAITGYAELMLDDGDMNPQRRDRVETIRRNGEHLLTVINDILDISKIEAGKMEMEMIPCSPWEILIDVVSLMQQRAKDKGIALEVKHDGPIPASIVSDPLRYRQVLLNLIGNAVKFTEHGSVRAVVSCTHDPEVTLSVSVEDTGIGMPPEQREAIFEAFAQADTSMSRRFGGTGLGLAISRGLAASLRGEISVESRSGEGSTFVFSVSLQGQEVEFLERPLLTPKPESKADVVAGVGGCRVLLVEDGIDNQRLVSVILERAGCSVEIASNGQVAVEKICEECRDYEIVLMDMQMPVLDGYAATRELRRRGVDLPVIALTAHAMSGDREECLAAGCDEYTTKPIRKNELLRLIEKLRGSAREAMGASR